MPNQTFICFSIFLWYGRLIVHVDFLFYKIKQFCVFSFNKINKILKMNSMLIHRVAHTSPPHINVISIDRLITELSGLKTDGWMSLWIPSVNTKRKILKQTFSMILLDDGEHIHSSLRVHRFKLNTLFGKYLTFSIMLLREADHNDQVKHIAIDRVTHRWCHKPTITMEF